MVMSVHDTEIRVYVLSKITILNFPPKLNSVRRLYIGKKNVNINALMNILRRELRKQKFR